jgi:hypothetical protein
MTTQLTYSDYQNVRENRRKDFKKSEQIDLLRTRLKRNKQTVFKEVARNMYKKETVNIDNFLDSLISVSFCDLNDPDFVMTDDNGYNYQVKTFSHQIII